MMILVALLIAGAFIALFGRTLKTHPIPFYAIAVVLDLLLLYGYANPLPPLVWAGLLVFVQRCLLAQALLVIVMFVGVLGEGSRVRRHLMPIRGELSVVAAILVLGHAVPHLPYLGRVLGDLGGVPPSRAASFLISAVLLVFLAALTVTSFRAVRRCMNARTWKRVQLLAYPFFGLIYVHLFLVLLAPALSGSAEALTRILIYTVVFLLYGVLRVRRACTQRRREVPDGAQSLGTVGG